MKRVPSILKRHRPSERRNTSSLTSGFNAALTVPAIAGVLVTPQSALTFIAYFAGVQVIAGDLSTLPLVVFQRQSNGGSMPEWGHPVSERFNWSMDGEAPAMNTRESGQSHILGWGNFTNEIDWDSEGRCAGIHMIHPSLVLPKRNEKTRKLYYEISASNSNEKKELPPWKVFHVGALGFNGLWGYSPVALGHEGIGMGKAAEQQASAFYGNGVVPSGVLEYPGGLKSEAVKNLRESINQVHQGSAAAFKLMILEQGMTWKQISISPEAAQMLASRQFQVIEICRLLRVPPHKLQDYTHVQPTNLEIINDDYVTSCLRPWCTRWEAAINFSLIGQKERAAGFYVRHDMSELLRANTKDRADWYTKMSQIGLYNRDEIAALENMNPIGKEMGGEKRFRQANLLELDAEQPAPQPGQSPGPEKDPKEQKSRISGILNGNGVDHGY